MGVVLPGGDLRDGLSIDEWQHRNVQIREERGDIMPFIDRAAQAELAREIVASERRAAAANRMPRDLVMKPRREGFTTKLGGRLVVRACTEMRRRFLYLNYNEKKLKETIRDILRPMWEHLPVWRRPSLENEDSALELAFTETESRIVTEASTVIGAGRGGGYAEGLFDEAARIKERMPDLQDQLRFLRGSLLPSFRYGALRLLFTPDGVGDITHHLWHESKRGENDWNRIFIPHWKSDQCLDLDLTADQVEEVRDTLTTEERELLEANCVAAHERVARIAWRRRVKRELGKEFPQEYPEDDVTCWISPGTAFFEADDLRYQQQIARPPIAPGTSLAGGDDRWAPRYNGALLYYVPPRPDGEYVVASDFGVGHGTGDPAQSAVMDLETGEVVAELYGHYDPRTFARMTIEHLCVPFNEALWAPESNVGPGAVAVSYGRNELEYEHVYRHVRWDGVRPQYAADWGWPTDAGTRPKMLELLYASLRDRSIRVNSSRMLADMAAFKLRQVQGRVDRYEAERGAHDEGVIVGGICVYVRSGGRRLAGVA